MLGVGRGKVTQVVTRRGTAGATGKDAPLGLDLTQDAGRVMQSHVQSNRGLESGEVNLTEVNRVSVGRPLPHIRHRRSAGPSRPPRPATP